MSLKTISHERSFVAAYCDFVVGGHVLWRIFDRVSLSFTFFAVGRLKEIQDGSHGVVVGPLSFVLEEERAVMVVRAESEWLAWDYDATRDYPGEDGQNLLSWQTL